MSESPNLHILIRNYYQSSYRMAEILAEKDFKLSQKSHVFVKDYWRPLKADSDRKRSPILLFPIQEVLLKLEKS